MDQPSLSPSPRPGPVLGSGTRLSEFEIVDLIGEGGFGIVYLAEDRSLARRVALKEYMPASLATRAADASVQVSCSQHEAVFETGLRSFVNEARLLAQFDHPALLKVYRFWEANGTAYMAMPYYQGRTLQAWLENRREPPDEAWIRDLLAPVLDALGLIHGQNCLHRDISPDNIMLLADEQPVLLDFGAARRVIGDMTQTLTAILKPGYAPIEQYAEMPGVRQGPWTDIYALGAVVYRMITGRRPPQSIARLVNDGCEPLARIAAGRYSEALLNAIDRCLAVRSEQRPQSIAELRELIDGKSHSKAAATEPSEPLAAAAPGRRASLPGLAAAALIAAAAASGLHWSSGPVAVDAGPARRDPPAAQAGGSGEHATPAATGLAAAPEPDDPAAPSETGLSLSVADAPPAYSAVPASQTRQTPAAGQSRRSQPAAAEQAPASESGAAAEIGQTNAGGNGGAMQPAAAGTVDQVFNARLGSECRQALRWLICREQLRHEVCQEKWSTDPEAGATICRLHQAQSD